MAEVQWSEKKKKKVCAIELEDEAVHELDSDSLGSPKLGQLHPWIRESCWSLKRWPPWRRVGGRKNDDGTDERCKASIKVEA